MARFAARTVEGAKPGDHPGLVEPALATLRDRVPQGADWLHELKFDGYRAQLHVRGDDVRVFTRRGYDWTDKFTNIVAKGSLLAANEAIIDGEAIVTDEDGNISFGALVSDLSKGRTDRLSYYAFDLLYLDGFDLRSAAQIERRRVLAELLAASPRTSIFFSETLEIQRSRLFERIMCTGTGGHRLQERECVLPLRQDQQLDQGKMRQTRSAAHRRLCSRNRNRGCPLPGPLGWRRACLCRQGGHRLHRTGRPRPAHPAGQGGCVEKLGKKPSQATGHMGAADLRG
jgi:hypothetical protein